jgi:hypothetical protein
MIDAFYIVLITVFGSLTILTLVTATVRANGVREELLSVRETAGNLEGRIHDLRVALQDDEFNIGIFDEEKRKLEAQKACLLDLEEEYKTRDLERPADDETPA